MRLVIGFIVIVLIAVTIGTGVYVVDQRQTAIVFGMGDMKEVIEEPGLYFKLPAPLEKVLFLDKRLQSTETHEDKIATAEKLNLAVDSSVKWRISDPRLFYINFGADDQRTQDRFAPVIKAAVSDEIAKRTAAEVISGDRTELLNAIKNKISSETRNVGVDIVDVRLKRVGYVDQINNAIYERMKVDRTRVANEIRSTGEAEAEKIRADADKQHTVILADAFRESQKIKGEGDAKASRIYAQAFNKNPEFYRFYKSLEAYRESFKDKRDILVIDPSSEFFRYMKHPKGAK